MRILLLLLVVAGSAIAGPRGSLDPRTAAYSDRVYDGAGVSPTMLGRARIGWFIQNATVIQLWPSMVCWPLRSGQNAGTGATAYSLGGLGPYDGTLVNGPTWGTNGMTFSSGTWITIPSAVGLYNAQSAGHLVTVATDSNPTGGAVTHVTIIFMTNASVGRALLVTRFAGNNFAAGGRRTDGEPLVASTTANAGTASYIEAQMNWSGGNVALAVNGVLSTAANFGSGGGSTSATNSSAVYIGSDASTSHFVGSIAIAMAMNVLPSEATANALRSLYKSTLGQGLGLP